MGRWGEREIGRVLRGLGPLARTASSASGLGFGLGSGLRLALEAARVVAAGLAALCPYPSPG